MEILVTGAAGFIGFHLIKKIAEQDMDVNIVGIDNLNEYYDVQLKKDRLSLLNKIESFEFKYMDLVDKEELFNLFSLKKFDVVINLAAQAGVRYSIENPQAYIDSNIQGFLNILESCREFPVKHLIYASSSSVYGGNKKIPFSTSDNVDHPVSLYAATKKTNELMAHTYSHLYGIPTTGLRFFTVYGPWGRPDMAYFSFTKNIVEGKEIKIFNQGNMMRDFTYIDDITEAMVKLIKKIPKSNMEWNEEANDNSSSWAPYKVYNIGNSQPVKLMDFIATIEQSIGKKANKIYMDMQPGDVTQTYADVSDLEKTINFKPNTSIDEGILKFTNWYTTYYNEVK